MNTQQDLLFTNDFYGYCKNTIEGIINDFLAFELEYWNGLTPSEKLEIIWYNFPLISEDTIEATIDSEILTDAIRDLSREVAIDLLNDMLCGSYTFVLETLVKWIASANI